MKRITALFCALLFLVSFASCSQKKVEKKEEVINEQEIAQKYDELFGSAAEDKTVDSGISVFGEGFSLIDLNFTSSDGTVAFSLNNNSFAKLNATGTYYSSIAPGSEVVTYDAGYKTSRGISIYDKAEDFITKYAIKDESAIYASDDSTVYYNPTDGRFTGKLTTLFASVDSVSYVALTGKDAEEFIYARGLNADGDYMDTQKIMEMFDSYNSVVSVDITADEAGNISEIMFCKFDK